MMAATDIVRAAVSAHPVAGSPSAGRVARAAWGRIAVRGGRATNDNQDAVFAALLILSVLASYLAAILLGLSLP